MNIRCDIGATQSGVSAGQGDCVPRRCTWLARGKVVEAIMLIDSHCHLDFPDFASERDAVVERARAAGLKRMIAISTRTEAFGSIGLLAETYEDVFCTVGTHP